MASKAQKALKAGPTKIGAKARAAANALKSGNGPKADTSKLQKQGKHAPVKTLEAHERSESKKRSETSSSSTAPAKGKHVRGRATGKHAAPETASSVMKNALTRSDAPSTGKHSKENLVSKMKAGMAERKAARAKVGRK